MQQDLFKMLSVVKELIALEDQEAIRLMVDRLQQSENAQTMRYLAQAPALKAARQTIVEDASSRR